ncbi:hypothetical protein [Nocardia cyriacigeorgica]|uniref:hypothetical protein n=1 Tax=Nocardia cyriacigeorgica TaxID=135487 RepID=UPI00189334B7|nr:hypothetical protein [Nocardia cyriacigeorgica]
MGRPQEPIPQRWADAMCRAGLVTEDGGPSLTALAEAAGLSVSVAWRTVHSKTRTGAITDATATKLAAALDLDTQELAALIAPGLRTKVVLSPAEQALVEWYRSLTDDARAAIDQQVHGSATRRAG